MTPTNDESESIWRDPEDWTPQSIEEARAELEKILARFRKRREKNSPSPKSETPE